MSTLSVRRPLALLAVLGMVATLLFAVAGTASAATAKPANEATFSACPDNADIPDAGFSDIPTGSFFDDAVNCLKYYTVTTGSTPTTYEPAADVTRAQMALFLARSAAAAGVVLKASPPDAGFTDISELSVEAQLAINALADAGIVKGKTATTFEPAQTVWRQQMALFLTRFLDEAIVGPGGVKLADAATTGSAFTDLGATTVEASKAINQAWDLGIAAGTTTTTFDPVGNVNRGQMSLFLTRTYAHANTRPAGINIQADPTDGNDFGPAAASLEYDVAVTARTAAFLPLPNTVVDQWNFENWKGATLSTPFKTDGTCNIAGDTDTQIYQGDGGANPCELEVSDLVLDGDGNYTDDRDAYTPSTYDLYAWTGATGTEFDVDTTAYSMVTVAPTSIASTYTFKVDSTTGNVNYGDTVTWTIQVVDADGDAFAQAGWTFDLKDSWKIREGGVVVDSGSMNPVTTLTSDAAGVATYTKTYTDPDKDENNKTVYDLQIADAALAGPLAAAMNPITWNDKTPVADSVTVSTPTKYLIVKDPAPTSNSATALVLDQYGDPISGVEVNLTSNRGNGLDGGNTVTTGSNGKATINYQWTAVDASRETIDADVWLDGIVGGTLLFTDDVEFYWVYKAVTTDMTAGDQTIEVKDTANKSLVARRLSDNEFTLWTWKTNDTFRINGVLTTQALFETEIAKTSSVAIDVISYSTTGPSEFDLGTV